MPEMVFLLSNFLLVKIIITSFRIKTEMLRKAQFNNYFVPFK
jgi:hypothetical protein